MPLLLERSTLVWISPKTYSFFNFLNWHFPILAKHFARDIIFLFYLKKKKPQNGNPFSQKYLGVYILYFDLLQD